MTRTTTSTTMALALTALLTACSGDSVEVKTDGTTDTDITTTTTDTDTTDTDTTPPPPPVCDAGTAQWVQKVMPLVWGRRPHGAAEIDAWVQMANTHGRDVAVRAMTYDREYQAWWLQWFTDALFVARTGDKIHDDCFQRPALQTHDGSIAQYLRTNDPFGSDYGPAFNMADVIIDGLVADDIAVIYQAHLFARMDKPVEGANVSTEQLEYNRRINFGELFYQTYLGRNMGCMACHNSEYSTTDNSDPALDHTWQLPGLFEQAIVGVSGGILVEDAYSIFRVDGVTRTFGGTTPWGMDNDCGRFSGPGTISGPDFIGQESSVFIESYGPEGSVWQVERHLDAGANAMAGAGLTVNGDNTVDGEEAFAYLVAANLADQVWETATGERLTIAHHFPRNEAQMERLKALADTMVSSGFSLRELLVAVATDEYFNAGVPQSCEADPYGMEPVFDPWVVSDDDPARRGNGPGDMVHRLPARMLLRTAHHNLGWVPREAWHSFFGGGDEEEFQGAIGVFLRESQPGFNGSDFQGVLSWETQYGICMPAAPEGQQDFIELLMADAASTGATVGDVAHALKDRLVSQGIDATTEQPLVEDLLGAGFADLVSDQDPLFEKQLRTFCGAVLLSPHFYLVTDAATGTVPTLARDLEDDCTRIADLMTQAGATVACDGTTLQ